MPSLTTRVAVSAFMASALRNESSAVAGLKESTAILLAGAIAELQSGFEGILAENVGDEIRRAALGLSLNRVDAKITRRHFRVENLFQANEDLHMIVNDEPGGSAKSNIYRKTEENLSDVSGKPDVTPIANSKT